MASVAIEASIEVAEVAAEAVAETVAETVAGEEENQLVLPCFTRQPRVHVVALNIMEECRVHVTWHHIGPFTHAIFDAISGAISRTKRALPYPARIFFS